MRIKVLAENKTSNETLKPEHGLSLYIETRSKKVLVDTGMSDAYIQNAEKMGVNIADVDMVIASHSHNDHTGGLPAFFLKNKKARLYISKFANKALYFRLFAGVKEDVSTPLEVFSKYSERQILVEGFLKIDDNIALVSGFKRKFAIPSTNRRLLLRENNRYVEDSFAHEVAVVIKEAGQLTIISGCSHNGIDNIIAEVKKYFPDNQIKAVIGGFHLMSFILPKYLGESRRKVRELGKRLLNDHIEKTYTCHCSGDRGYKILKSVMGDKIQYIQTGDILEI